MKKEIYIALILLLLLIPTIIFIYTKLQKDTPTEGEIIETEITTYAIEDITNAKQIIWEDTDNLLIITKDSLYSHNISIRESIKLAEVGMNTLVGIDNDNPILCTWTNSTIYSTEEFATTISIYDLEGNSLWEEEFHETMKVVNCNMEKIIAKTAFEFMEQNYYSIDINNTEISQIEYTLPIDTLLEPISVTPVSIVSLNEKQLGIIDNYGAIWIQLSKKQP